MVLDQQLANGDPSVLALMGIAETLLGQYDKAASHLQDAETKFAAAGLLHFAFGTQIHLGYCKSQRRRASGEAAARAAIRSLVDRGARSFAWPHAAVLNWIRRLTAATPRLTFFGRQGPIESRQLPLAVRLQQFGLTGRELEIAVRVSDEAAGRTRKQLAAELRISTNTLRVHVMRIRHKLEVAKRGDPAIREAIDRIAAE